MHVSAFYASSVQLDTRPDIRETFVFISHELVLTKGKACGIQHNDINASRDEKSLMGPDCSNAKEREVCIIPNIIDNSAGCSTTPKWRSVIVQSALCTLHSALCTLHSADMHVSASVVSEARYTRRDTRDAFVFISHKLALSKACGITIYIGDLDCWL
jgi:hypothetical protein